MLATQSIESFKQLILNQLYIGVYSTYQEPRWGKIRLLVKLGSTAQNLQAHKSLITSLSSMMWEKNASGFTRKLNDFFVNNAC